MECSIREISFEMLRQAKSSQSVGELDSATGIQEAHYVPAGDLLLTPDVRSCDAAPFFHSGGSLEEDGEDVPS